MAKTKVKTKTVYIVRYNDCYGVSGNDDTSIEAVLQKESDFKKWLKMHNADRKADGNEPESEEEFDIEGVQLVTFE